MKKFKQLIKEIIIIPINIIVKHFKTFYYENFWKFEFWYSYNR